jgi:hypothetical protein
MVSPWLIVVFGVVMVAVGATLSGGLVGGTAVFVGDGEGDCVVTVVGISVGNFCPEM